MTITTTQKIIKIGTSHGVTIPAKDLKQMNAQTGDEVEITVRMISQEDKAPESAKQLDTEYQAFKTQYHETLRNLANR